MTNAERIRGMKDEELANFLNTITTACSDDGGGCYECPLYPGNGSVCGEKHITQWLQKEAEDVGTDQT